MESRTQRNEISATRNYGIDLLRIVSMVLVILQHIIIRGGLEENSANMTGKNNVLWLMYTVAVCAVNCYALITGYVSYGKQYRFANLFYLILQGTFYALLITGIFAAVMPETIGAKDFLHAAFPVPFGLYWYLTAYFCLSFFIPFINRIIDRCGQRELQGLILCGVFVLSIFPTIFQHDMALTNGGMSFVWLTAMYVIGAYLKKYAVAGKYKTFHLAVGAILCVAVSWLSKLCIEFVTNAVLGHTMLETSLICSTSPTVVLYSVFMLLLFSKLSLGNGMIRFVKIFAPLSFGVYLIHVNRHIYWKVLHNGFISLLDHSVMGMVLWVLGCTFAIWLVCSLIDLLRLGLFRLLRVKSMCVRLEMACRKMVGRMTIRNSEVNCGDTKDNFVV